MNSFMLAHICPELVEPTEQVKSEERELVNPKTELDEIKVELEEEPVDLDSSESSAASTPSSLVGAESPEAAKERKSPRKNPDRPPFSYNALIAMAIQSSPLNRMTLADIYQFIASNFPYYARQTDKQWQNSVRHNLSLHKEFIKVPNANGRGNCWAMTDAAGTGMYISSECGKFKRRVVKRLSPPPAAPVLPSLPLAHFPFPFPMAPGAVPPPFVLAQNPHLFQLMMNIQSAHGV